MTISIGIIFSIFCDFNERADKFLCDMINISRTRVQKNILNENFSVNGNIILKSSYSRFRRGDVIELEIEPVEQISVEPENIDLNISFENGNFLIIDKPAGLVVHPGAGNPGGTLVNGLMYYLGDSVFEEKIRPGLVHRIDKDTSGLLVVAKNMNAFEELQTKFSNHDIEREYTALVSGKLKKKKGTVDTFHGRDPGNRLRFSAKLSGGRRAVTHYKVVEEYPYASLLKIKLETGRTHQIRMHMSHIGHPVVNDVLYGGVCKTSDKKLNQLLASSGRQLLHAGKLGFSIFGEHFSFESSLHEDMQSIISYLDNISGGLK